MGLTISYVTSAESTGETIVIPAGAAIGDVAVLADFAWSLAGDPTDVVPTGWTGLVEDEGNNARFRISYKILTAGNPGATITGMNGNSGDAKLMFVFRASTHVKTVTASTWLAETADADPASQAVSASGQNTPLVVLGFCSANVAVFNVASPAFDAEVAIGNDDLRGGYKIYNASPADHTIDMADLGDDNALASGYLIFAGGASQKMHHYKTMQAA